MNNLKLIYESLHYQYFINHNVDTEMFEIYESSSFYYDADQNERKYTKLGSYLNKNHALTRINMIKEYNHKIRA